LFDRELDHLPPEVRWREWMNRVEATIFAASEPVGRDTLARIVGKTCRGHRVGFPLNNAKGERSLNPFTLRFVLSTD
jgi:chromosome segregation and condensation protein ScpB